MKGKQILKKFLQNGWLIDRKGKGDHYLMLKKANSQTFKTTIPVSSKELNPGLEKRLLGILRKSK